MLGNAEAKVNQESTIKLLSLKNCQLNYENQLVLHDINLDIEIGEKVALIGKSGSGKSTLLKHMRSLLSDQVAWCPQELGLVPNLSVYHNIYMGALKRNNTWSNLANLVVPNKQAKKEIENLAKELGLSDQLWTSVDHLSGGQQQRAAIGRAFYQHKNIVLADEPVKGLDDFQSREVLNLICEKHSTIILCLHDVELAKHYCERIIGIANNSIAFDLASNQLDSQQLNQLYK